MEPLERALDMLEEWRNTSFFDRRDEWQVWRDDLAGRVDQLLDDVQGERQVSRLGFQDHVRRELQRAREKHHDPICSIHAAYGIIAEELEEFWEQVKRQQRDKPKMIEELIQIAAMAQRAFEDLRLEGWYRPS